MSTQPISESLDFNSPLDLLPPWGRFNPVRLKIDRNINLTKDSFTVGRAKECDFSIEPGQIENEMFYHISNIQFRVERRKFREKVFVTILEDTSSNGTYCNGILVGKNQKIVLSDNDSIAIAKKNFNETSSGNFGSSGTLEYPQEIRKVYAVYELLGRGGYGEVRFAVKKDTVQCLALKIIRTEPFEGRRVIDALTEVKVLQKIKHKNIVELYNVVILGNEMFITLEFMPGGDFAHYIMNKGRIPEEQTKFIFFQIFEGVNYLHTQNIIHRDLKPANILLSNESNYPIIKITDFGLSKIMEKHVAPVHTQCGTKSFAAPELQFSGISKTYDYRADVWSLGVMMFLSLSGVFPFSNKRNDMPFETQINLASFSFEPSNVWKVISSEARNIIKKCLVRNPQRRWHVRQILNDKWITEDGKLKTLIQNFTKKGDKENAVAEPVAKKIRVC